MTDYPSKDEVVAAGRAAACFSECPYRSGQGYFGWWMDAFVDRHAEERRLPEDADSVTGGWAMYALGRISFRLGYGPTDYPARETATGRWFSGWLAEKDRHEDVCDNARTSSRGNEDACR